MKSSARKILNCILLITIVMLLSACTQNTPSKEKMIDDLSKIEESACTQNTPSEEKMIDDLSKIEESASTQNTPSKKKMIDDLSKIEEVVFSNEQNWHVDDVSEELARTIDKKYETTVTVKLYNDFYKSASKKVTLYYDYYDKGGWQFNSYENVTEIFDAIPRKGIDETFGINYLTSKYDGTFELISHNTDILHGEDELIFKRRINGKIYNKSSEIIISYALSETTGMWELCGDSEINITCDLVSKNWYYSGKPDKSISKYSGVTNHIDHVFYIDSFDGKTIKMNIVDYEQPWWNSTGIYGQGFMVGDLWYNYKESDLPEKYTSGEKYIAYTLEGIVVFDNEENGFYIVPQNCNIAETILIKQDEITNPGQYYTVHTYHSLTNLIRYEEEINDEMKGLLQNIKFD